MTTPWFKDSHCHSLEINNYKSDHQSSPDVSLKITDQAMVKRMIKKIEQIPADGDEMISFAPNVHRIELIFGCKDGGQTTIEIYEQLFKTPSTGFNSQRGDVEKQLYEDIEALLFPALKKRILKVEGLEFKFKDFSVTYLGETVREQQPGEPSIGPVSTEKFVVKDKKGKPQELAVFSGQNPPEPLGFEVNEVKLRLLTFHFDKKDKQTLYPIYFQIVK